MSCGLLVENVLWTSRLKCFVDLSLATVNVVTSYYQCYSLVMAIAL